MLIPYGIGISVPWYAVFSQTAFSQFLPAVGVATSRSLILLKLNLKDIFMKPYALLGWIGFLITCVIFIVNVVLSKQFLNAGLLLILAPFICYFVNKRGWYWISIVLSLFLLGVWSSLMGYLSRIFQDQVFFFGKHVCRKSRQIIFYGKKAVSLLGKQPFSQNTSVYLF